VSATTMGGVRRLLMAPSVADECDGTLATTLREHKHMKGAGDLWFQAVGRKGHRRRHPAVHDASSVPQSIVCHESLAKGRISPRWRTSLP
jgi:hypothetical protein